MTAQQTKEVLLRLKRHIGQHAASHEKLGKASLEADPSFSRCCFAQAYAIREVQSFINDELKKLKG